MTRFLLVVTLLSLQVAACGQKGPLELPRAPAAGAAHAAWQPA